MRRLAAALVALALPLALATPAQAHSGTQNVLNVVAVVDTKRDNHSVAVLRYAPRLAGKTVTLTYDHKRLWGCSGATWRSPGSECAGYRQGAYASKRVALPRGRTQVRVSIPVDVADYPGIGSRDAVRLTYITAQHRQDWRNLGVARVLTPRKGDPTGWLAPYSWRSGWDSMNGPASTHLHRTTVRR